MNVVVFSGTTEGRELSRQLAALGIEVTVSVATPLGQEEQGSTPGVTVRCGRLLPDEMAALLGDAALCIDATHPYAVEATKNIKAAAEKAGVGYLRLLRPASPLPENCLVFESAVCHCLAVYCNSSAVALEVLGCLVCNYCLVVLGWFIAGNLCICRTT